MNEMGDPTPSSPGVVAVDVLESLLEGCQVIGFDWTYLYVNASVVRQGRRHADELLGRTMMASYPGIETTPMFAALRRCMTERVHDRMENEFTFPDGSTGWFELRFVPVPEGVCILSLDITARKQTEAALARSEAQLRHAQKMEAIGRLAGGVAHDFNNLLSVILSYGSMLLGELPAGAAHHDDVAEIVDAARRGADLTRQLLTFSRHRATEPAVLDVGEAVHEMDRLLQRILGADIELVAVPATAVGRVRVDPSDLEQVVLNLVVNARDAMPDGGQLTIETSAVVLDDGYAAEHLGVTPGPYVMIAVSDTGIGMDRATQERIFEPFFTTKARHKGTGLGLATVFGIVQQAGGTIWTYSEPGKGTTFKVYLPRVDAEPTPIGAAEVPAPRHGTECVLLVEDDDQLRVVAGTILRRHGYQVLEARNPGEALLHAEQHPAPIDLLLSDVVMPQLSGPDLALRLADLRPTMKVLLMSGYTDDSVVRHHVVDATVAYLQKPITPATLTTRVRQVLDDGADRDRDRAATRDA
ncbi:MAG: response regulator [Kofleriaceae bacterium]|nr:response regulator [Kofleriaceae bacterium]